MADETKTITIRLPVELYEAIETARGAVPREPWIREILQHRLLPRSNVRPRKDVPSFQRREKKA